MPPCGICFCCLLSAVYCQIFAKLTTLLASLVAAISIVPGAEKTQPSFEVVVLDVGAEFRVMAESQTVRELLEKYDFVTEATDVIFPSREEPVRPGTQIKIIRATPVILNDGGKTQELLTQARRINGFLTEQGISVGNKDYVSPDPETEIAPELEIIITRISEKELTRVVPIPQKTIYQENPEISYGKTKLIAEGKQGKKEKIVLVTYKNGARIKEIVLSSKVLQESIPKIYELGTKIEIGRTQKGRASWYCPNYPVKIKTGLTAASRDYPNGTFLRITNLDDKSKSVIVEVTDWVKNPDIVIDLWCTAFKELAPLSKGIIPVKVEEIL